MGEGEKRKLFQEEITETVLRSALATKKVGAEPLTEDS